MDVVAQQDFVSGGFSFIGDDQELHTTDCFQITLQLFCGVALGRNGVAGDNDLVR